MWRNRLAHIIIIIIIITIIIIVIKSGAVPEFRRMLAPWRVRSVVRLRLSTSCGRIATGYPHPFDAKAPRDETSRYEAQRADAMLSLARLVPSGGRGARALWRAVRRAPADGRAGPRSRRSRPSSQSPVYITIMLHLYEVFTYIIFYITFCVYPYVCACMCVCVCVRARVYNCMIYI